MQDWDANIRLFLKAGGSPPPDSQKRITFIRMLPVEVGAYVSMHWELPEYASFSALKKFAFKYVKVLRNLKKSSARPAHLIDLPESEGSQPDADAYDDPEPVSYTHLTLPTKA